MAPGPQLVKNIKKILILIPFIALIYFANKFSERINLQFNENFKKDKFSGRVEKKYIDKIQHNFRMLVISSPGRRDSLSFTNELSGFWDFVNINDSVIKIENSNKLVIVNRDTSFLIDFK